MNKTPLLEFVYNRKKTAATNREAAKGKFDFVINTLPTFDRIEDYINTVSLCGYYVQVGAGSFTEANVTFNIFSVIVKEVKIVGSIVGPRHTINEMLSLCVEKDIYPMVEEFACRLYQWYS